MSATAIAKIPIMLTLSAVRALRHLATRLIIPVLAVMSGTLPAVAGATQSADAVEAVVSDYLEQQAASYPGTVSVAVDASRATRHPACTQLSALLARGQKLRSRMSVEVRCHAPEAWTARVQAEMSIKGYFYVPNRPIDAGDSLSLDDLIGREGDLLSLGRGVAIDPSRIIGHIAVQRIPQGVPIKLRALRSPESIPRGQQVRTEAQGPGFVVTGEGQAMQAGAPGDRIRVRTPSGRIITGTVIDAGTVSVNP